MIDFTSASWSMSCSAPLFFMTVGAAPASRIIGDCASWAFFRAVIELVTPGSRGHRRHPRSAGQTADGIRSKNGIHFIPHIDDPDSFLMCAGQYRGNMAAAQGK